MSGLASFEFVLCLPILLVLILLLFNVASLALTRIDVLVAARNGAMAEAYGLSRVLRLLDPPLAANGEYIFVSVSQRELSRQSRFFTYLRRNSADATRTQVFNAPDSSPHVGVAQAFFFGDRPLGIFDFAVEGRHATFAQPIWERTSSSRMRLGHDRYLDTREVHRALPNAFPATP